MDVATCAAKVLKKRGELPRLDRARRSTPARSASTPSLTARASRGSSCLKTKRTTTPPRSSRSAARLPAWAARSATPFGARLCLSGDACDRRGRSPHTACRHAARQAAPAHHRRKAAAGYSSYGNQIGLATGLVDELYHPGYVAKRLETGAVIGAAPAENVRREAPRRATLSSCSADARGATAAAARPARRRATAKRKPCRLRREVQKGNAPRRAQAAAAVP